MRKKNFKPMNKQFEIGSHVWYATFQYKQADWESAFSPGRNIISACPQHKLYCPRQCITNVSARIFLKVEASMNLPALSVLPGGLTTWCKETIFWRIVFYINSSDKFSILFHNVRLILVQSISPKISKSYDLPIGCLDYENPSLETHSRWIV